MHEDRIRAAQDWSAYAVTLHQRVERLVALARRRGIAVALGPDAAQNCASDAVKLKTGCR